MRRPGRWLLWVAALASVHSSLQAAELDVHITLGFSGTFRLEHWTPVTVTVENEGSVVRGTVEIEVAAGNELTGDAHLARYRHELVLPHGSRKRLSFTVRPGNVGRPLVLRIVSGGRELLRREVELRTRFTERRLLLALGRDLDLDYLGAAPDERLRVLYPHPSALPDRWQGYDGVAAVVLHGISLENLDERQYQALEEWLARGGILAVSGGPDYALLASPRLARLLPGVPAGLVRVRDAAAVGRAFGVALQVTRAFDVNRVTRIAASGGQVVYAAHPQGGGSESRSAPPAAIPLVTERGLGRGKVVYLAIDVARYPFDRWPGMSRVWGSVLALPPGARATAEANGDERAMDSALRDPVLGFPGHLVLLAFIVLYLVTAATALVLLGGREGPVRRALLAWGPPLAFAPVAYLVFGPLLFPARPTAVVLSVVEPLGPGPYARVTLEVAQYALRGSGAPWPYTGGEPTFTPVAVGQKAASSPDWVFTEDEPRSAGVRDPQPYVVYRMRGRDVVRFELEGVVRERRGGIELEVSNGSGSPIEDAWLVLRDEAYPLGRLADGAGAPRRMQVGPEGAVRLRTEDSWWKLFGERGSLAPPERVRELLLERAVAGRFPAPPRRALLVGFTPGPIRTRNGAMRWTALEVGVVVQTLAVETERGSGGPLGAEDEGPD